MESCLMTVVCRPDLSTLARIVSVLHARRIPVIGLRYTAGPELAQLECDVRSSGSELLAAQLRRAIGVESAEVTLPAVVAVAS